MKSTKKLIQSAAAALMAGALCANAAWAMFSKDYSCKEDFSSGITDRVIFEPEAGGIVLNDAVNCVPYLWVPCPNAGVVCKIDARSGKELAKYAMGPKNAPWWPCAVASDPDGNVYVACGSVSTPGKVVKINASAGKDINGDGVVSTSCDKNGDGVISPSETLTWGKDERVGPVIDVGAEGSGITGITFDQNGYLWVSLWGERSVAKIDINKGQVLGTVQIAGRPSTALVGPRDSLWVLSSDDHILCQVNTVTATLTQFYNFGETTPNSMCIDENGKLWFGTIDGLVGFVPEDQSWSHYNTEDGYGLSGVTVDKDGDIWAACPENNNVVRFSCEDCSVLNTIPVGKAPGSMCTDNDGYVWALNEGSSTATRIDPRDDSIAAVANTADLPFCNSPFTATVIQQGISPVGNWSTIADAGISGAGWGKINWKSVDGNGKVRFAVRSADEPSMLAMNNFQDIKNGEKFSVPNGRYLEIKAIFDGDGNSSPVLQEMNVEGKNLPPDVSNAKPTFDQIAKLDGSFEWIGVTGVKDPEGDPVKISITDVTQDEPVSGLSKNDKFPDAMGIGETGVWLRGECDPGTSEKPGNGRVYIVSFKAVDSLGAYSIGKVKVEVPASLKPGVQVVDDGQRFDAWRDPVKDLVAER